MKHKVKMLDVLELLIFQIIEDQDVLDLVVKIIELYFLLIILSLYVQKVKLLLNIEKSKFFVLMYKDFVKKKLNYVLMIVVVMVFVYKITHVNVFILLKEKVVMKQMNVQKNFKVFVVNNFIMNFHEFYFCCCIFFNFFKFNFYINNFLIYIFFYNVIRLNCVGYSLILDLYLK